MNEEFTVTCEEKDIQNDKEVMFNIQKAMLATLFEGEKINHFQYEYAIELLEKKFRQQ